MLRTPIEPKAQGRVLTFRDCSKTVTKQFYGVQK